MKCTLFFADHHNDNADYSSHEKTALQFKNIHLHSVFLNEPCKRYYTMGTLNTELPEFSGGHSKMTMYVVIFFK
jgi:hypothetical protein